MRKITAAAAALCLFAGSIPLCGADGLSAADSAAGVFVKNTGDAKSKGVLIVAEYDDNGILTGVETRKLELEPGEEDFAAYPSPGSGKAYVYDGGGIIKAVPQSPGGEDAEDETVLIDYYRATVATVGGDGYEEYVLYPYSGTEARLSVYSKDYGDEEESRTDYIVPYEAVEKCLELIDKSGFRGWKDMENTYGITGAVVVVKFREDDGSYVRVSSEDMPDGGREAMDAVGGIMRGYMKDEYKK